MSEAALGGAIIGGIVGGIGGGLAVLLFALFQPRRKCPDCEEPLPKYRKPTNFRQFMWGGWTCKNCGCEVDRRGRRLDSEIDEF
jgi:hypothetical protein